MLNSSALTKHLELFFGYGRWDAPIWFIGIEEAGGRSERELKQRLSVWVERGQKELEDAPTFYPASGNSTWHGVNAVPQATWTQLIRIAFTLQAQPDTEKAILDYQRFKLGSSDGDTALLELFPLPSPNLAAWNYPEWTEIPWVQSRQEYEGHIITQRISLLCQKIDEHHPQMVIFYGAGQLTHWRKIMGAGTYARPIPDKLIAHERDGIAFFVMKHPTDPSLDGHRDDYFREIGNFLFKNYGKRIQGRWRAVLNKCMTTQLGAIKPTVKTGNEPFHQGGQTQGFNLIDFWRWSASDLITNTARGVLAEFIVAKALDIAKGVRNDWGAYDLEMPVDGKVVKIEVKSKAFLQSWDQDELVLNPLFVVKKAQQLDQAQGKYAGEPMRQADVYVFALLAEQDKLKLDPMDMNQWRFYVLPTSVLNKRTRSQHSITLHSLEDLPETFQTDFSGLKQAVLTASKQGN